MGFALRFGLVTEIDVDGVEDLVHRSDPMLNCTDIRDECLRSLQAQIADSESIFASAQPTVQHNVQYNVQNNVQNNVQLGQLPLPSLFNGLNGGNDWNWNVDTVNTNSSSNSNNFNSQSLGQNMPQNMSQNLAHNLEQHGQSTFQTVYPPQLDIAKLLPIQNNTRLQPQYQQPQLPVVPHVHNSGYGPSHCSQLQCTCCCTCTTQNANNQVGASTFLPLIPMNGLNGINEGAQVGQMGQLTGLFNPIGQEMRGRGQSGRPYVINNSSGHRYHPYSDQRNAQDNSQQRNTTNAFG